MYFFIPRHKNLRADAENLQKLNINKRALVIFRILCMYREPEHTQWAIH